MVQNPKSRYTASGASDRKFLCLRLIWSYFYAKTKMDVAGDNFDRNKMPNLLAFLIESTFLQIQSLARHCNHVFRRFMENFEIAELCDAVSDKLAEHPLLRFIVFTAAISCTIPVVMFILFGIASFVITFAFFILIEGTLLVVCGLSMFACMAMMILVLSLITAMLVAFYVLTLKLGTVLNKFEPTSNLIGKRKFLQNAEHLS